MDRVARSARNQRLNGVYVDELSHNESPIAGTAHAAQIEYFGKWSRSADANISRRVGIFVGNV